jgi:hypothetical protein
LSAPGWERHRDALLAGASADTVARGRALGGDRILALVRRELAGLAGRHDHPARDTASGTAPPGPTIANPAGPDPAGMPPAGADAAATSRSGTPPAAAPPQGRLCREGGLWRVTFAGTTAHLPALRGIDDLAVLLAHPGREVPALDLAAGPGGRPAGAVAPGEVAAGGPADLGEQVDATARAAYARRIRDLREELDDADAAGDGERGARAQVELDALTRQLAAAYGLHGARRTGDPAERARAAVSSRLRAAVRKISQAHPTLGRHLDRSLRTGRFCSYAPDEPVTWQVDPGRRAGAP